MIKLALAALGLIAFTTCASAGYPLENEVKVVPSTFQGKWCKQKKGEFTRRCSSTVSDDDVVVIDDHGMYSGEINCTFSGVFSKNPRKPRDLWGKVRCAPMDSDDGKMYYYELKLVPGGITLELSPQAR
jgi:hypothetical protein